MAACPERQFFASEIGRIRKNRILQSSALGLRFSGGTMSLERGNDPLTIDKDDGKCHPVSLALNIFQPSESLYTSGGQFAFYGN
jgi:hypothetical protein